MKLWPKVAVITVALGVFALGGFAVWSWTTRSEIGTTISGLLDQLQSPSSNQRRDAAAVLGQTVGPAAEKVTQKLIVSLRDPEAEIRKTAARSLAIVLENNPQIASFDAAIEALTASMRDRTPGVQYASVIALSALRREPPGMIELAIEGIRLGEPGLKSELAQVINSRTITDINHVRALLALLENPTPDVVSAVRTALVRPTPVLSPEVVLPALPDVIASGPDIAREIVATMLGRSIIRVSASRDMLIRLLRDEISSVRLAAAAAMGAFSEDAIGRMALRLATDDADLRVRATASASLAIGRRATRAEALADLKVALENDPSRRDLVLQIQTQPALAAQRLAEALRDRNTRVRAAAARCLGEVAGQVDDARPMIDALTVALGDFDPYVRRASAAALARYGPAASGAVAALQGATRDTDRSVSGQALLSIKELENSRVK